MYNNALKQFKRVAWGKRPFGIDRSVEATGHSIKVFLELNVRKLYRR